jgi:ribosome maturation factor RimP
MHEAGTAAAGAQVARSAALRELIERTLAGMGYELVELERAAHGLLRVTLDIDPERPAPLPEGVVMGEGEARHVGIEDCERVSRHLSHLFAVEDVDYERLEVSSPGMDRPLRGARDFARFAGEMAKVQLFSAQEGRRRLRGRLEGLVEAAGQEARVRMTLVPEAPPPPARGARRTRARPAAQLETIEFALGEVEKARLAPDWEFDRSAMGRAAAPRDR